MMMQEICFPAIPSENLIIIGKPSFSFLGIGIYYVVSCKFLCCVFMYCLHFFPTICLIWREALVFLNIISKSRCSEVKCSCNELVWNLASLLLSGLGFPFFFPLHFPPKSVWTKFPMLFFLLHITSVCEHYFFHLLFFLSQNYSLFLIKSYLTASSCFYGPTANNILHWRKSLAAVMWMACA